LVPAGTDFVSEITISQPKGSLTARAVWLMFAKTMAFGFSLALPLLLVRRLNIAEFGLYKQAFQAIGTAIVILPLSFGMSAYYFLPRETDPVRRGQVVLNTLLFNLCIGGAVFLTLLFRPQFLAKLFNNAELNSLAPLVGAVIMLWIFAAFLEMVTVANEESRLTPLFVISAQLTKTALLVGAAATVASVRALLWAALAQGLAQSVVLLLYLRSRFPGFWRKFDFALWRAQFAYALPFGLLGILWTTQTDLHTYFVSQRFGAELFAVYAVACFDIPLISILTESVNSVMIPRVSFLQSQNRSREIVSLAAGVMRKLASVYFPLYAFLMLLASEFIHLLFTQKFAASIPLFRVNLTLLPLAIVALDAIVRAHKELGRFLLIARVILLTAMVGALWFGVRNFSLYGMIWIVISFATLERVIITVRCGTVLGVGFKDLPLLTDVGKIALATLAACVPTYAVRLLLNGRSPFVVLAVTATIFGLTYICGLLVLRVPNAGEREIFWRKVGAFFGRGQNKEAVDPVT
jgi:O-antigen/teichoic acid export membrane protein